MYLQIHGWLNSYQEVALREELASLILDSLVTVVVSSLTRHDKAERTVMVWRGFAPNRPF